MAEEKIDSPDIRVAPLADAVASLGRKTPVVFKEPLRTAEIAQLPLALREAAQFSATVDKIRYLQYIQDQATKAVSLVRRDSGAYVSREKFVAELQALGRKEGLFPQDGTAGTLRDPTSEARTRLIYDIQTQRAAEFARWNRDQDPTRLSFYPCQELIRIASRKVPRDWQSRWLKAGGQLYRGRMIARKDSPVWKKISRFETPWPPFDFNSGMGLRDISRSEAETLGVIRKDEEIKPGTAKFNDGLQASVKDISPEYRQGLKDTFGDQIVINGDTVQWQGNVIADLFEAAKNVDFKERISLGKSTSAAIKQFKALDIDLTNYEFDLSADEIRHAMKRHGPPGVNAKGQPVGEKRKDQRPLTSLDFQMIPHVLRDPDIAGVGDEPDSLAMTKNINGNLVSIWVTRSVKTLRTNLQTYWAKK